MILNTPPIILPKGYHALSSNPIMKRVKSFFCQELSSAIIEIRIEFMDYTFKT
jgi:hypothetical protein